MDERIVHIDGANSMDLGVASPDQRERPMRRFCPVCKVEKALTLNGRGWVCEEGCEQAQVDAAMGAERASLFGHRSPNGQREAKTVKAPARAGTPSAAKTDERVMFVPASMISPKPVRHLWTDRLPLSALALFVGREGTGKSTFTSWLTASVTRGSLPGDLLDKPANVILATLEDPGAQIVVPRLMAANADLHRVELVQLGGDDHDPLRLPDDLDAIERRAKESDARLVVVDPLVAALPEEINSHRDQHVRRVLAPFQAMAERLAVTVLTVIHFNKASGSDANLRVSGSIGFVAAARSVLALGFDPDDPAGEEGDQRILAQTKANWSRRRKSIRCTVRETLLPHQGEHINTVRLELGDECDVRPGEFFSSPDPDERHRREDAEEWLLHHLADCTWKPSADVKAAGRASGHKERTVKRAFQALVGRDEAEVREEGFPRRTDWRLTSGANPPSAPGLTGGGPTGQTRSLEPNPGGSEAQSGQTKGLGPTEAETPGPDARAARLREQAQRPLCTCFRPDLGLDGQCQVCHGYAARARVP